MSPNVLWDIRIIASDPLRELSSLMITPSIKTVIPLADFKLSGMMLPQLRLISWIRAINSCFYDLSSTLPLGLHFDQERCSRASVLSKQWTGSTNWSLS
jgi:hypothetical protein